MPVPYLVNFTNVNHYRLPLITNYFLPVRQLLVLMVLVMAPIGQGFVLLVKLQMYWINFFGSFTTL